ncbi:Ethanolamine kinase [Fasciola gigantica]|uniref:ethanolamine kinase n=1 Tax=Fasciola gigantica TaxID=46835 RepID=A0A504YDS2_FASGI|nr:Ethanolamine kinase [Fasciola gigantica]
MAREIANLTGDQRRHTFDSDIVFPPALDLFVDGPNDVLSMEKLTYAIFPFLVGSKLKIKVFDDGNSNQLLLVSCAQQDENIFRFLIRINGVVTNSMVNRDLELSCLLALFKLRGTPEVYCTFNNGICYSFVNGISMVTSDLFHEEYKWLICDELAHFHSLPMYDVLSRSVTIRAHSKGCRMYDDLVAFQRLRDWIGNLPDHMADAQRNDEYHSIFPTAEYLLREAKFLEDALSDAISPVVFCHNDILASNIILSEDKDKVTFIDYEFCGFNHAAFEIGNHFCEYAGIEPVDYTNYPSLTFQREWIAYYLKRIRYYRKQSRNSSHSPSWEISGNHHSINGDCACPKSEEVERWLKEVNYFALVAHLTWGVWAAIRASNGPQDFDFLALAFARIQEYERIKPLIVSQFSG